MKKIVALFDIHYPHNIPLDPVLEFMEDFKPDVTVIGGDAHDFAALSYWASDQSRTLDGGTIKENLRELNNYVIAPIRKAVGKKSEIVYLEGNHEHRIALATTQKPDLRGFIELEKNLPPDIKFFPINIPYRANKNLVFIHGLYLNVYHARRTVDAFHKSVYYGHVHTFQSHMAVSPVDVQDYYIGQSIGCLSNLNPDFMKNKPNAWTHGFAHGYMEDDNTFQINPTPVVKGKFWALGRKYR